MKNITLFSALPNKWLLIALSVTVALTLWAFFQEDTSDTGLVELADRPVTSNFSQMSGKNSANATTAINQEVTWQLPKRMPLQGNIDNPFKVHSWLVVAPVQKVKAAPPPPPVAPAAPFIYMGKFEQTPSNPQIFLIANGRLFTATQGKNIDAQWRLDGEDTNNLRLTYLPLNLPQILSKATRTIAPTAELLSAEMNM